jgi:hypothetical protein
LKKWNCNESVNLGMPNLKKESRNGQTPLMLYERRRIKPDSKDSKPMKRREEKLEKKKPNIRQKLKKKF